MMWAQGRRLESFQSCCLMGPMDPAAEQLSSPNLSRKQWQDKRAPHEKNKYANKRSELKQRTRNKER